VTAQWPQSKSYLVFCCKIRSSLRSYLRHSIRRGFEIHYTAFLAIITCCWTKFKQKLYLVRLSLYTRREKVRHMLNCQSWPLNQLLSTDTIVHVPKISQVAKSVANMFVLCLELLLQYCHPTCWTFFKALLQRRFITLVLF